MRTILITLGGGGGGGAWRDSHKEQWGRYTVLGKPYAHLAPLSSPHNSVLQLQSRRDFKQKLDNIIAPNVSAMILLHFHTAAIQARLQAEAGHHHRSKHVICLS